MTLHALRRADRRRTVEDHALIFLRAHLDARNYAPCIAAAQVLEVPDGFDGEGAVIDAAALAVAQTYGLLDAARDTAAVTLVRDALAGGADHALDQATPDTVLLWCTAAAEWCERNGLDAAFNQLAPRAALADADPNASAWTRVQWRIASAWHHEAFGRRDGVSVQLAEARGIAQAVGDVGLQVVVWLKQARLSLSRTDPATALVLADRAAAHADEHHSPLWLADAADVASRTALIRGDMHRALHQARRVGGLAARAQAPPSFTVTYRVNEVLALLGLGAWDDAIALAEGLAAIPLPARLNQRVELFVQLIALVRDDRVGPWSETSVATLRGAICRLRELDWPGVMAVLPDAVARLWTRALAAQIEPDWVRASIISRDLAPPEAAWPAGWPWAVRIRVLGPFACSVNGSDLANTPGKGAAKTLALLRRLAAEGGFDGLPSSLLAEALWPGEGREGREKALESTLSRLRRLLGRADAVLLHEHRLRLNPRCVWLDSAVLESRLNTCTAQGNAEWSETLALWRGVPLVDEPDAPWLVDWRGRQRMRLAAALQAAAAQTGHRARCLQAVAADPGLRQHL
jgi:hypothetical protein